MNISRAKIMLASAVLPGLLALTTHHRWQPDPPGKASVLLQTLAQGLAATHYQPQTLDNAFSRRVWGLYLKQVDPSKKFLRQADVEALLPYQDGLDEALANGNQDFLNTSTRLLDQRTREAQALCHELLAQPFDFTQQESIETEPGKLRYAENETTWRDNWRRLVKYHTLLRLSELLDAQEKQARKALAAVKAKPSEATVSTPLRTTAELEAEARKRVRANYDEWFANLRQTEASDRLAQFAGSVANAYDPHTEYFAPIAKENFDIGLTGRLEGTGAQLGEQDGQIVITDIVPGSAAYRQGELKIGDIIQQVAQGSAAPVPVEGLRLDKVVKLVRGKKGTEVRLTVKSADARVKVITLVRDVVVLGETYAQTAVVQEAKGRKVGYVRLPSFYADFNNNGGRSSAADVKNALARLQQEHVDGVVVDLRYNGGGSLQDAVQMAGLFVKSGAMVQVKSPRQPATILTDPDPRVQYDGPLVVLVNKYSASASEIFAAAIQDYRRGLVLGAPTFGKGTVQRVFDLDQALPGSFDAFKPLGSLKSTVQKYYRISGGSTQFKGVVPDVVLPDLTSAVADGEQQLDFPLPWDEIPAAPFQPWAAAHRQSATAASQKRVAANAGFQRLTAEAQRLRQRKETTRVSLNLTAYRQAQRTEASLADRPAAAPADTATLQVALLAPDSTSSDSTQTNRAARLVKPLQRDLALREAMAVIHDLH